MGYLKMQGGEWLVTGHCSEPKYQRVGKDATPRCSVGIAAGKHPTEVDEQGNPATIWINVTAWREQADILAKVRRGEGILVSGSMYEREYNGQMYKGINANVVLLSQAERSGRHGAAPSQPPAMAELEGEDGELPF